jgi:ubiquinone/menaquinone biosynthesis C-methylase UbiE
LHAAIKWETDKVGKANDMRLIGHTDREQLRLIRQARILAHITEQFLRGPWAAGMRVLDIVCGMDDVTMLAAQLVEPAGRVVSIDLDRASIETARQRASTVGLDNVNFHRATPRTLGPY